VRCLAKAGKYAFAGKMESALWTFGDFSGFIQAQFFFSGYCLFSRQINLSIALLIKRAALFLPYFFYGVKSGSFTASLELRANPFSRIYRDGGQ
jgi:hypothetical protein